MTDPFEHYDAAYAFDMLEPGDRTAFEAHLRDCAACRERVEQARSTVTMLHSAEAGLAGPRPEPVGPPPDTLLPALLQRARRERTRRRRLTAAALGLAAACLVGIVGVVSLVVLRPGNDAPNAPAPRALVAVRTSPVTATATLTARHWGTEVVLHCRYQSSDVPRVPYRLVVVDAAGDRHDAGSWRLVAGGTTTFTGGTDVARDRIRQVQITLPDGRPVLRLSV